MIVGTYLIVFGTQMDVIAENYQDIKLSKASFTQLLERLITRGWLQRLVILRLASI